MDGTAPVRDVTRPVGYTARPRRTPHDSTRSTPPTSEELERGFAVQRCGSLVAEGFEFCPGQSERRGAAFPAFFGGVVQSGWRSLCFVPGCGMGDVVQEKVDQSGEGHRAAASVPVCVGGASLRCQEYGSVLGGDPHTEPRAMIKAASGECEGSRCGATASIIPWRCAQQACR